MFQKAERKQAKLKIGISGPSGSGKTFSALQIAKGIGGRIAVLDSENHSSNLYADRFDFDVCVIDAPYTTDKYLAALNLAQKEKYDVIIIDSASHQWAGDGGILNRKEQIDSRGGNSFTNWSKFTPEHERFKAAVVQCNAHLICTFRSKQDYSLGDNDKGKKIPQKIGLAPIQRDGFEYELTVMLDMAMDHSAQASKDRTSLFDGQIFKPGEETGRKLMEWLAGAKPMGYRIPQGSKYGNKSLEEIPVTELREYIKKSEDFFKEKPESVPFWWEDFVIQAQYYLGNLENNERYVK